jgi:hypothetical protein
MMVGKHGKTHRAEMTVKVAIPRGQVEETGGSYVRLAGVYLQQLKDTSTRLTQVLETLQAVQAAEREHMRQISTLQSERSRLLRQLEEVAQLRLTDVHGEVMDENEGEGDVSEGGTEAEAAPA